MQETKVQRAYKKGQDLFHHIQQAPTRSEIESIHMNGEPAKIFNQKSLTLILRDSIHKFIAKDVTGKSATITYHLILSLIPILGIAFTFFKVFGGLENLIEDSVIPKIASYFDSSVSGALASYLQGILANMSTGTLGTTALLTLILTIVGLMGVMEKSFNEILEVKHERAWIQRMLNYWLLITLTPFVAVVSTAKSTELLAQLSAFFSDSGGFIPESIYSTHSAVIRFGTAFTVEALGFAVIYFVLPAKRVTLRSAVIGGIVAAIGFESLQLINAWATAKFFREASMVQLYGSVPLIVVVLFIWMRLVSLVLLTGMTISASFHRIIDRKKTSSDKKQSPTENLILTIHAFALVMNDFQLGKKGSKQLELGQKLALPRLDAHRLLIWLESVGLLWSHKESGGLLFSPTQRALKVLDNPQEFIKVVFKLDLSSEALENQDSVQSEVKPKANTLGTEAVVKKHSNLPVSEHIQTHFVNPTTRILGYSAAQQKL